MTPRIRDLAAELYTMRGSLYSSWKIFVAEGLHRWGWDRCLAEHLRWSSTSGWMTWAEVVSKRCSSSLLGPALGLLVYRVIACLGRLLPRYLHHRDSDDSNWESEPMPLALHQHCKKEEENWRTLSRCRKRLHPISTLPLKFAATHGISDQQHRASERDRKCEQKYTLFFLWSNVIMNIETCTKSYTEKKKDRI